MARTSAHFRDQSHLGRAYLSADRRSGPRPARRWNCCAKATCCPAFGRSRGASVNPMTVSKAYSRLETEGVVRRVRGLGHGNSRPRRKTERVDQRKQQFRETIEPALHRGPAAGPQSKANSRRYLLSVTGPKSMNESVLELNHLQKVSAQRKFSAASIWQSSRAPCWASWAPTAAAKRRSSSARWVYCGRRPDRHACSAKMPGTCRRRPRPGSATCRRK